MRMGMRMRVRVDGGRRRWRKSLMKTSGHADTRVIHVMLHRRMHRVMMLRRTHRRTESRVEGLVVEIKVSAGLDHVTHDTTEAQAAAGLLLLAFRRELPVSRLDALLFHRQRPVHVVQLVVEPASVADRLAGLVPPPESRGRRLAVGAAGARPSRRTLQRQAAFRLDEGSILTVHLVVKPTGVAEVVPGAVSSPKGCRRGAAIHALATLFTLLHLAGRRAVRAGGTVAAVVGAVVLLMRRRGCPVMVAEHHRRLDVARAGAGCAQRVLMVHERAHYRRVCDRRLVLAGGTAAQSGERITAVIVIGARRIVVVRAGGRAGGYAVGRSVLGRCRRKGEEMVAASATVTRQTSGGGRQRGSQGTLRLLVVHSAARGRRRRGESPGCLRGVRAAAGQPWMENRGVEVRPADLAHRTARHAAVRHPCVGVVGRSCGVMRRRSGVRVVTPVIVADHSGHPGTPRRRLQPGRLIPRSSTRLAAHVHRVQRDLGASRSLAEERAGGGVTAGRGGARGGRKERERSTERRENGRAGPGGRLGVLPKAPLFLFRRPRDAQWDHR